MTKGQYDALGPKKVLQRLLAQHEHLLALRLASYLGLAGMQATVTQHWGVAKIPGAAAWKPDELLRDEIVAKLRDCPGVSFAQVSVVL